MDDPSLIAAILLSDASQQKPVVWPEAKTRYKWSYFDKVVAGTYIALFVLCIYIAVMVVR